MDHRVYCVYFCGRAVVVSSAYELSFWHISVNVNRNFLTWLEERNYCYEVREGALESQNRVGKRLTKITPLATHESHLSLLLTVILPASYSTLTSSGFR